MFCAIDFGTSNSAIAVPAPGQGQAGRRGAMHLVELEPGHTTMPTAVFYFVDGSEQDGPPRAFGRAALSAYIEGVEGRLMRSMKSILGSQLIDQTTDVGGGRGAKYLDIVAGYLRHLKRRAEAHQGAAMTRVVLGRPVFFVDEDPARDAQAESALRAAAHAVGFEEVHFQFEPIAAAFDFERQVDREKLVLVADIGGGTSDFSLVRVGPERRERVERKNDILASHGVHVAGTDFDRRLELEAILPHYGFGAMGPAAPGGEARPVPSGVYFDLATWHLINTVYTPSRVAELRSMKRFYADRRHHERLMLVVEEHLGHELMARAEQAKIEVSEGGDASIDLSTTERGLCAGLSEARACLTLEEDIQRIVAAGIETVALAGVTPEHVDALYFTGGSTGMRQLTERIAGAFPSAAQARGDRFASVATGLGLHAERLFASS